MSDDRDGTEDDGEREGLAARVASLLERLGKRDRDALAAIVERDRSYGERPARREPR